MLERGKVVRAEGFPFPPLLYTRVVIPSAQIKTSFTTPVTVIAAVPNASIHVEKHWQAKSAGLAYTLAGVTGFGLQYTGGAQITRYSPVGNLDQTSFIGFLNNGSGNGTFLNQAVGSVVGLAVEFACTGANPAAGDTDITYWIEFRIWPNAPIAFS